MTNTPTAATSPSLAQVEAELQAIQSATPTPEQALDAWLGSLHDTVYSRDTAGWNEIHAGYLKIKAALANVKGV